RTVTFDQEPKRFVVANYVANFLLVAGEANLDKVVAIPGDGWEAMRKGEYRAYTKAFPELKTLPSIGGYHDDILNSEKILALKPDVLLVNRSQYQINNQRLQTLEKAGIKVVVLDYHAMKQANHIQSTKILGRLLSREAVADDLCNTYTQAIDTVKRRIEQLPASALNKTAYFELGNLGANQQGNSYAKDFLWGGILTAVKAKSLSEGLMAPYAPLTREAVISGNPQYIFIGGSIWENAHDSDQMRMGLTVDEKTANDRLKNFANRPLWNKLDAVKTGHVYGLDHGSLRNIADWAFTVYIAKVLYPETFADMDPEADFRKLYERYLPKVDISGTYMFKLH
ncbi:MAG: ABC transporter substrate-binding protein, partial [Burkholderiaceae bacterium]|nr:ABC transporter substrate-binding protein [Burkholderiaceae bacterium]